MVKSLLLLSSAIVLTAACGGSGSSASAGSGGGGGAGGSASSLEVFPSTTLHTGVDEAGGYTVNIAVVSGSGLAWTSSDPATATVTGDDKVATITALKAGSATITATAGSSKVDVPVEISTYTVAQKMAGAMEYKSTCAGCHDGSGGPDITPSDLGKHTDAEATGAFAEGKNPEGGTIDSPNHIFTVTDKVGMVAYLRSLPPRQPPVADQ
jgi:hypothetical protein